MPHRLQIVAEREYAPLDATPDNVPYAGEDDLHEYDTRDEKHHFCVAGCGWVRDPQDEHILPAFNEGHCKAA